jgi:hypothetical protein
MMTIRTNNKESLKFSGFSLKYCGFELWLFTIS